MKAIVCEMCDSHDVVKQDGLFVCQSCGTKYTPEDAKKLMVDVSGSTVKVDESSREENLRKLAREAKDAGNAERAADYYGQLAVLCPDDWEATFFSVYFTSASCKIGQIASAASHAGSAAYQSLVKISKHLPKANHITASNIVADYVLHLRNGLLSAARDHYTKHSSVNGTAAEFEARKKAINNMIRETAEGLILCGNKDKAVSFYMSIKDQFGPEAMADILDRIQPGLGLEFLKNEVKTGAKDQKGAAIWAVIWAVLCGGIFAYLYISYGYFDLMEYFEDSFWAAMGLVVTFLSFIGCLLLGAGSNARGKVINNAIKKREGK